MGLQKEIQGATVQEAVVLVQDNYPESATFPFVDYDQSILDADWDAHHGNTDWIGEGWDDAWGTKEEARYSVDMEEAIHEDLDGYAG